VTNSSQGTGEAEYRIKSLTNCTSALQRKASSSTNRQHAGRGLMTNGARQMTPHIEAAYKDTVENMLFLKRQQWVATNYAVVVYAAIFVISGTYFSRTDIARNTVQAVLGCFLGEALGHALEEMMAPVSRQHDGLAAFGH
jgi:hypothetical protein